MPVTRHRPAAVRYPRLYSFYFSRGLWLEADILASVITSKQLGGNVISVVAGDSVFSVAAADALDRLIAQQGGKAQTLDIRRDPDLSLARLAESASAIVLWLNPNEVRRLAADARGKGPPLFLSATLGGADPNLPAELRTRAWQVQLSGLPNEPDPALRRFQAWARGQGVKTQDEQRQALAYFACMVFAEGVKHTGLYISRDYVLDLLNHSSKLTAYLPLYTRGSITPWQRVLSRGGYLIDFSGRTPPTWRVP